MLQSIQEDARYIIAAALVQLNVHEDSIAYGFRELKEYWNIEVLPGKKFSSVYMHVFLTQI